MKNYQFRYANGIYKVLLGWLALFAFVNTSCQRSSTADTTIKVSHGSSPTKVYQQPNIIFYVADDQDIYDYGCYGNEKVHTPAVDQLAREGLLFENAFTGQAICAPSRSQLLTGKYPLKNGCFANHTPVKPDIESITQRMQALGYEVVLAGKSHIKPDQVFDWDIEWKGVYKEGVPREYIPLDSIENFFKKKRQKPFFLLIASYYPHAEYFKVENAQAEDIQFYPFNEHKKSDKSFVNKKAGYYRSIQEDNTQLEKVLQLVDKHLDKNTLFMYSADHGVSGKFTVKDIGLRVPLVARWPDVIEAGTASGQLVHYVDMLPTFLEIAGGESVGDLDGKSILPLLQGRDQEIHQYVYGVRTNQNILVSEVFPARMIRDKRYKYIRNFNSIDVVEQNLGDNPNVNFFIRRGAMAFKEEPFEVLYDLQSDPFEQNNLIEDVDYQGIKNRLCDELFKWMELQGDFLNEEIGNMPLITGEGNKGFKLDQNTRLRTIPDSMKNTLNEEDYLIIKHW
ncbi:sulfatase [Echinicola sp. 20G]|uniref:sulfatase family protein n=1 Tax=Echinicola sp. 20G TaxID=2781961 RepID=UPI00191047FF|nr:sulfatase [Echinicola sp. 20G]